MNEQYVSEIDGAGVGLRGQHIPEVLQQLPDVPWFEVLADNHLAEGGLIPYQLAAVRSSYPITFHCVGMSIAGVDDLDMGYLKKIKDLAQRYEPTWISDHLCFTQFAGYQYYDLLPFPYTQTSLRHICERVMKIQDFLNRPLVIENVSTYVQFKQSDITEAEFLIQLCNKTGSEILLDINNAYVNEVNHGIDAKEFIRSLPMNKIREVHLAGYEDKGDYLIDAHNNKVSDAVWELYTCFVQMSGGKPTLIEWDNELPAFDVLQQEAVCASEILNATLSPAMPQYGVSR